MDYEHWCEFAEDSAMYNGGGTNGGSCQFWPFTSPPFPSLNWYQPDLMKDAKGFWIGTNAAIYTEMGLIWDHAVFWGST